MPATIGPAALATFANACAEIAAVTALLIIEPGAWSAPASTERVSVAWLLLVSSATVWSSVAPSSTCTFTENEPSEPTVAATLLTMTEAIGVPCSFGVTVPVTVTVPAALWIRLRCGDVTVRTGGSCIWDGPPLQADARSDNPVSKKRFRMAVGPFSKPPAKSAATLDGARGAHLGQFHDNATRRRWMIESPG